MEKQNRYWLLYLIEFVGVAGVTTLTPILPFFVKHIGGTISQMGIVMALMPLTSITIGPIVGYMSDRVGRRPILIISLVGIAIWYGLFALATNIIPVYIGQLIGGIFAAGAVAVVTAYAAETAGANMGGTIAKLQAAQMLGALIPPLAAGYLATVSLALPYVVLTGLTLVVLVLCIFFLHESLTPEVLAKAQSERVSAGKVLTDSFGKIFGYLKTPLGALLLIAFLIAFPTGFFEATLSLLVSNLGLGTIDAGIIFSSGVLLAVIANVTVVGPLIKRFGEWSHIIFGMVCAAIFYVALPLAGSFIALLVVNSLLTITTTSMRPAHMSLIAKNSPESEQALSQSAYNQWTQIGRVFGPPLGTSIYSAYGGLMTYIVAAVLFVGAAGYTYSVSRKSKGTAVQVGAPNS